MKNEISKTYIFWIIVIIVQTIWIFNSDGYYFIDDACHFNYSRHYFLSFTQSSDAWHRVGRLLLFVIPAQFGLKGVQIASSILFLITIYFAYKILKQKNVRYAEWVIPLIGFQPVLFNISYTALAELPTAFLIVLSCYFYIKKNPKWTMIVSSMIFAFRTEYYYVAGLFFLIYLYQKNYRVLPYIFLGPVFWYIYSTIVNLNPIQFFKDITLHSKLLKIDEGIDWNYYLIHSAKIFGVIQIIFFVSAIIILLFRKQIKDYVLILIIIFFGFAVQTLLALKGLNLTCSIGQLRYVAVFGPMLGIISAYGMSSFFELWNSKLLRTILQIILIVILFLSGPFTTPFHNKFRMDEISEHIARLAETKYPDYKVLSHMHQLANAMDEPFSGGDKFKKLNDSCINAFDKSIIVWCNYLEGSPFVKDNVTLSEIEAIPGIKMIEQYKDVANNCTSIPIYKYRREGDENKFSREIIDYVAKDQTSWETLDIRVFVKE